MASPPAPIVSPLGMLEWDSVAQGLLASDALLKEVAVENFQSMAVENVYAVADALLAKKLFAIAGAAKEGPRPRLPWQALAGG